jgi:hypothetical protein
MHSGTCAGTGAGTRRQSTQTVHRLHTTDHDIGAAGGAGGVPMGGIARGHTVASARVPAVVDG